MQRCPGLQTNTPTNVSFLSVFCENFNHNSVMIIPIYHEWSCNHICQNNRNMNYAFSFGDPHILKLLSLIHFTLTAVTEVLLKYTHEWRDITKYIHSTIELDMRKPCLSFVHFLLLLHKKFRGKPCTPFE